MPVEELKVMEPAELVLSPQAIWAEYSDKFLAPAGSTKVATTCEPDCAPSVALMMNPPVALTGTATVAVLVAVALGAGELGGVLWEIVVTMLKTPPAE